MRVQLDLDSDDDGIVVAMKATHDEAFRAFREATDAFGESIGARNRPMFTCAK